jgi:tetratricopeptide (TPR) repeat protein
MNRTAHIAFGILLLAGAQSLGAQQVNPRIPPPPPPAEPPATTQPAAAPAAAASPNSPAPSTAPAKPIDPSIPPPPPSAEDEVETPAAPSGPVFDPLHAQRSLDVGTFYLNKGNYDAAIDRFLEASNYQPTLAMPWKMLGEAYEKKHEYAKAAESYNKYLRALPHAADVAKIRKLISELEEKVAQDSPKKAER